MGQIRILVVDGDAVCREALREIFDRTDGLKVIGVATTGPEALEAAVRLCPDVVVVDVQTPQLDGIAVTKALGCNERRPGVVCLTVYPTRHDEACAAGVSCFILKDSPPDVLVQAVRKSAARYRPNGTSPFRDQEPTGHSAHESAS